MKVEPTERMKRLEDEMQHHRNHLAVTHNRIASLQELSKIILNDILVARREYLAEEKAQKQ